MQENYDFVVIGAGSAGSIIASRLSEDGRFSVLVLEAGGWDRNPWIHIPIGFAKTFTNKAINWAYSTEPEHELNGRNIYWPRGKVIGGSGAINGLIYVRGQRGDFDGWRDAGCTGWGWSDVLPHFRKVERHHLGNTALHGDAGPVHVQRAPDPSRLCEHFIAAGVEHGLARNGDFNSGEQEGVGYYDLTLRNGRRSNSATGALHPAKRRANLTIEVRAHVQRVLFDGRRARAVEYRNRRGETLRVGIGREVVMCSGAVNTPQLLMLSGVGPRAQLQAHGIPVVAANEQVGSNLQDHVSIRLTFKSTEPITLNDDMGVWWRKAGVGLKYALLRRGPLTYPISQAGLFTRSSPAQPRADLQVFMLPFSTGGISEPPHRFSAFSLAACQSWPTSRGSITLRNADPRSTPVIRANYLSAASDRQFFIDSFHKLRELARTPTLGRLVQEEHGASASVCTDDEILSFVRATGATSFHACGTCRMGSDDDAVVDVSLKLRGVDGVRVADASIMPSITSGNINAPCLMIGEKAAALMLAEHQALETA